MGVASNFPLQSEYWKCFPAVERFHYLIQ